MASASVLRQQFLCPASSHPSKRSFCLFTKWFCPSAVVQKRKKGHWTKTAPGAPLRTRELCRGRRTSVGFQLVAGPCSNSFGFGCSSKRDELVGWSFPHSQTPSVGERNWSVDWAAYNVCKCWHYQYNNMWTQSRIINANKCARRMDKPV